MKKLAIFTFLTATATGCTHVQLEKSAQAALITEKSAAGGLRAVDAWAGSEKDRCKALNLQTAAERAECIGDALKAVEISETVGKELAVALEAFWDVWSVLKAKSDNGKLSPSDWAQLTSVTAKVLKQFDALRPHLKKIEGK